MTSTILVDQIHCAGCEDTIRTALSTIGGVRGVWPDATTNTVTVSYVSGVVAEADLHAALARIGFDPVA